MQAVVADVCECKCHDGGHDAEALDDAEALECYLDPEHLLHHRRADNEEV